MLSMIIMLLFDTVSSCAAIQVPLHSTMNTTVAVHSTVVLIQCDTGYKFPDNSLSIITECVKSNWTVEVNGGNCTGKNVHF